jgi:Rieske Fe-S protein
MEGDAAYRTRRAPEEKAAARKATHPKAREAHLELAQRFDELARSITSSEKSLGLDLVLDPGRKSFASFGSVTEFASGQAGVVENLAEYLTPGEIGSADELQPGEGGILRDGISKIAVFRTNDGQLVRHSAVCTHMGCIVHWNSFEKCWDCPCHGSQFAPEGEVLNGPAVKPLAQVEHDEVQEEKQLHSV